MSNVTIIIILCTCVLAAIGLIVGFIRGYTRLSCWGGSVVGATLVCFVADRASNGDLEGWMSLVIALASLIVITFLFYLVKRSIRRRVEKRKKLSFYRQHDEMEENDERILVALDKHDKKAYRKHSKRRFRQSGGGWGALDRIFGALTLTINIFTAIAIIGGLALIIIDCAGLDTVKDYLSVIYENDLWQKGAKLVVDMIVVALMCMCLRVGYNGGILSALSVIVILGLIGGAGYLSYHMVFNTELFNSPVSALCETLTNSFGDFMNAAQNVISGDTMSRIIITAGVFIVLLIPVIIISIFVPRAFDKLRSFKTIEAIDGAIGALVLTAVIFAVLAFLGSFVYGISDLEAFATFNGYMESSSVANGLYAKNFLNDMSFMQTAVEKIKEFIGLSLAE